PVVREPLLRPGLPENLERLDEAVAALAVGYVEALVVARQSAPADAELEAALGDVVDSGDVLSQTEGRAERQDLDGNPDLDAPRAGCQGRGDDERGGKDRAILLEVDLGQPYGIKAEVLGRLHLGQGFVECRGVRDARRARKLRKQAEFHPTLPIEFGIS